MSLKSQEIQQQYKNQIEQMWLENRYKVSSGLDYIHFLFFIYGKLFVSIALSIFYVMVSYLLAKLFPQVLQPGSYKMLFSEFAVLFLYFFKVVPLALKKKYNKMASIELETFIKNDKHLLKQVVVLKDQVQGCVELKTLNQYENKEIKRVVENCIKKKVKHLVNSDVYVLDSICIKSCQQQQEFASIMKTIVGTCEEHLNSFIDKNKKKDEQKRKFLVAPTFSMSVFDVKYLLDVHKFEIQHSHFIGGFDVLFGVSHLILVKEI